MVPAPVLLIIPSDYLVKNHCGLLSDSPTQLSSGPGLAGWRAHWTGFYPHHSVADCDVRAGDVCKRKGLRSLEFRILSGNFGVFRNFMVNTVVFD